MDYWQSKMISMNHYTDLEFMITEVLIINLKEIMNIKGTINLLRGETIILEVKEEIWIKKPLIMFFLMMLEMKRDREKDSTILIIEEIMMMLYIRDSMNP